MNQYTWGLIGIILGIVIGILLQKRFNFGMRTSTVSLTSGNPSSKPKASTFDAKFTKTGTVEIEDAWAGVVAENAAPTCPDDLTTKATAHHPAADSSGVYTILSVPTGPTAQASKIVLFVTWKGVSADRPITITN